MANQVHVRVSASDLDRKYFRSDEERCKVMRGIFKRTVDDLGILTDYKRRQSYESKSEKRRRKCKESAIRRKKEQRQRQHNGE